MTPSKNLSNTAPKASLSLKDVRVVKGGVAVSSSLQAGTFQKITYGAAASMP